MIVFLITLGIIASLSIIVIGYLIPYIILGFYAIKRKITIKSLMAFIDEYDNLSELFALSHIEGWACGILGAILSVAYVLNHSLSYNEMIATFIITPIVVFCMLLIIIGCVTNINLEISDDNLRKQSIKI